MIFKSILNKISEYFENWSIYYFLIVVISGISSFVVQMIATGLPLYCVDIGKSTAESGIMAGFYTVALILSRPFTGKLTDEKGKWNISFIGILLMIVAVAGMSLLSILVLFNVYQLIEGLAFSALSTALAALLIETLSRRTVAKGIAFYTVIKSLSISLGASFAVSFAEKYGSSKIFLCCLILLLISLILILFLKKKPEQNEEKVETINQDNTEYTGINKYIDTSAFPVCIIQFLFTFALTLGTCYLPSYALTKGIEGTGIYYTISAITMLASRTVLARVLDKISYKLSFVIGMLLAASTTIAILVCNSVFLFALISIPNAIGICMINPMLNVKATANVPKNRVGVASSTYYAFLDLGSGAGSMIWGLLVPVIGYINSFIAATIILAITLVYGKFSILKEI